MAGTDLKQTNAQALLEQRGQQPAIILVEPQMGENIGAVARAMLNCGLTDLRLVKPRDGWPNPAADAMASGALAVLEQAQVFHCVADAIGDIQRVYATTARGRDLLKPVVTPRRAASEIMDHTANGQKTGFLFGPERAGLSNEDLVLADALLSVPLNPGFSSLNLAQAVLLVAYEWYQAQDNTADHQFDRTRNTPAPRDMTSIFFDRLEGLLDAHGFFRSQDQRPVTWRNLRSLILRMEPGVQDLQTLHGVLTALTTPSTIAPQQPQDNRQGKRTDQG